MPEAPDFLILGAGRAGTTWLSRMLDSHPQISMSVPKEPHFLAEGAHGVEYAGPADASANRRVVRDESQWRALFATAPGVLAGEASVSTLSSPERSIPVIERLCPDARMIVMIRAPWERARSAHQVLRWQCRETLSFQDALAAEPDRERANWNPFWLYRSQSLYTRQLRPFLERFGDQVLVVEYEQATSTPDEVIPRILRHLGVDVVEIDDPGRVNASVEPRFRFARKTIRQAYTNPQLRRVAKRYVPHRVRHAVRWATSAKSPEEPEAYPPGFVESFDEELGQLAELLGRAAPTWCRSTRASARSPQ